MTTTTVRAERVPSLAVGMVTEDSPSDRDLTPTHRGWGGPCPVTTARLTVKGASLRCASASPMQLRCTA